jgi:hypothetical protein
VQFVAENGKQVPREPMVELLVATAHHKEAYE